MANWLQFSMEFVSVTIAVVVLGFWIYFHNSHERRAVRNWGILGLLFMCLCEWLSHVCRCLQRLEEASGPLKLEIQAVGSRLCGYWKLSSGSLKEQQEYLGTEPSLQPYERGITIFKCWLNNKQIKAKITLNSEIFTYHYGRDIAVPITGKETEA